MTKPKVVLLKPRLRKVVRTWQLWVGVTLVAAAVVGWSLDAHNYGLSEQNAASVAKLAKEKATLTDRLDEATTRSDGLADDLASMTDERDRLAANQQAVVASAEKRENAVTLREGAVKTREGAVKRREQAVAARERAVTKQEKGLALNTIAAGAWAVGVDVRPGTYRTSDAVSGDCYWEIDADANGDDIVANDIVTGGRPTVTLRAGQYFTTNRCGSWHKV